jgi:hypothetical protein
MSSSPLAPEGMVSLKIALRLRAQIFRYSVRFHFASSAANSG